MTTLQKLFAGAVSIVVIGSFAACGGGGGKGGGKHQGDISTAVVDDAINAPLSTLSQPVKDTIAYMYSEEKLAHEVYLDVYAVQPQKQLYNIATRSEVEHMDAVNRLAVKYDLNITRYPDTVPPYDAEALARFGDGQFPVEEVQYLYDTLYAKGITSAQDALEVGCMVEVTDVNDLDRDIALAEGDGASDVVDIFNFLRDGSYNHYWAFDKGLKNMGISDGCCSLGDDYCHPEYPQR